MTGRYPHRNGGMGFEPIWDHIETLQERLREAGYLNGILGKVTHLAPVERFKWDVQQDMPDLGFGRDPQAYAQNARSFFAEAKASSRPFFLMANAHDPHPPASAHASRRAAQAQYPFSPQTGNERGGPRHGPKLGAATVLQSKFNFRCKLKVLETSGAAYPAAGIKYM